MEGYCDLGKQPTKMNDVGIEEKINYPTLNIGVEDFPALGKLTLGSTGVAEIKFKIDPKYGGLKVYGIKMLSQSSDKKDKKKEDKNELQMEMSMDESAAEGE